MAIKRLNLTISNDIYRDLKALNDVINSGEIKVGTFVKLIVTDFVNQRKEKYYINKGKVVAKQEDLFSGRTYRKKL